MHDTPPEVAERQRALVDRVYVERWVDELGLREAWLELFEG